LPGAPGASAKRPAPAGGVGAKTTLPVAGENAGAKLATAQQPAITVLTEEQSATRIANHLA
jgi:NAD-dependent DNA ligase